ncbi:MAG: TonB-dependent receptor [Odoribacter sp.]|nr:TonB-dependent receptor [Odoribacter sp.]
MNIRFYCIFLGLLLSLSVSANDRSQRATLRGIVKASDNEILEFATVYLKNTPFGTSTDPKGIFHLNVPAGKYNMVVSAIGYESYEVEVELQPGEQRKMEVKLESSSIGLNEVVVTAKSVVKQINETAYNVVAIDAKALHNTTLDLAHALNRISGIKLKEVGGLGSETQIFLNGFTGRHVKIFMDGVPMEGSGSAFGLNNIPINMADRIEVYKGVVPVELGADALGGAINIVTKNTTNTFLDVAYTYGSFNTHKSTLSLGHTAKNGFTFQFNAYQNYSDNNYKVKTKLLDLETNIYSQEEYWFKRFHDNYHNEAIIAKIGVRDKSWATRMMLEMTASQEKADIQNGNLMKIVYGGKKREAKSFIPAFVYEKRDLFTENLNFGLTAKYSKVKSTNLDTLARQYNWNGDYIEKRTKGEGDYLSSEYNNNTAYVTGNLNYKVGEKHHFSLNHVYSDFSRKATDAAANYENSSAATFMKRTNSKNVLGLSYKFNSGNKWNASAFTKYYAVKVTGPIDVSTSTASTVYEEQERKHNITGYGVAATYLFTSTLQLKSSFEKSYRLPSERELFGDEVLESGDAGLKPENSRNVNVNLSYTHEFNEAHSVLLDAGFIYRDTRDYIRRKIDQSKGGASYVNHGQVRNLGLDMEAHYFYKNKFSAGGNLTWQNLRNRERYNANGQELAYYNDRMPNVPYLFSNIDANYNIPNLLKKNDVLTIGYGLQYIHEFFRSWKSEGGDISIPTQVSHDFTVNYSLQNGRYNVAFEAKNITNEMLFDNYSLQKPGRSFYVKLRYYFYKGR